MRPAGQYAMSELIEIGGIQPLMKTLLAEGLMHGDCLTVTGKTLAENLATVPDYPATQKIIRPLSNPIKKDSHLVVLRGNLAPEGAVAKITGHEGLTFTGTARCFHGEEAAMAAIMDGTVDKGDVVIVRYEGPKGGPGMREMLSPTSAINGRGLSEQVRFSRSPYAGAGDQRGFKVDQSGDIRKRFGSNNVRKAHRFTDMKALCPVDTQIAEYGHYLLALDIFCDRLQLHNASNFSYPGNHRTRDIVFHHVSDKATVDLNSINIE